CSDRSGSRSREDRLVVFRTDRAALACFDHDRLGPTATHILAHRTLAHPRWFQGESLLARNPACLVVVLVGHSVPVPSNEDGWRHQTSSINACLSVRRPAGAGGRVIALAGVRRHLLPIDRHRGTFRAWLRASLHPPPPALQARRHG